MAERIFDTIFKKGSQTFFNSTKFFPDSVRKDVSVLYAFVRIADDFVDAIPPDKKAYYEFKDKYEKALKGQIANDLVIDSFVKLSDAYSFEKSWVEAFFASMEMDLVKSTYRNIEELEKYLYGSSEVVGLMMAKIMNLPKEAYVSSRYLGRGMQFINFIRDIREDLGFKRTYFPQADLKEAGLQNLNPEFVKKDPAKFISFLRKQILRYLKWMKEGEKGYKYIPKKYLIPIKTAADTYIWTANRIYQDPFIVYRKKVKPGKLRILLFGFKNLLTIRK